MATLEEHICAGTSQDGKLLCSAATMNSVRNVCDLDDEGEFTAVHEKVVSEAGKIGYVAEKCKAGWLFKKK